MLTTVKGIVVSETPFKESSKILNIYTKEFGIIGVMSKGCKNMKSPLRVVSQRFSYAEFILYYNENKMSTLKEGTIINNFNNIKSDLLLISYFTYITDLVTQVVKQNESKDIYDLYINTILKINDGLNPKVMTNILEIKLLDYLGCPINLKSCCKCGGIKNIVTIDPDEGGYICADCYTNEIIYDSKVQKMLSMYYMIDISSISELKIKDYIIEDINKFLNQYYDRYTGVYIHSKKFLENNIDL